MLARPDGSIVASAEQSHEVSLPRPGWVEHDAERVWWHDVRRLVAELLVEGRREQLAGVCISGIGPCLLPCDAQATPLRPAILYGVDTRAQAEIEELDRRYGEAQLLARSGSTLTSQALGPKLLWLRRHQPGVWERTAGWYMASSFVIRRLTGEYVLDHHSASQCDPLYDLEVGDWARDWAEEIAPGPPLPRLVWPGEIVGVITEEGSRESGLPAGIPVTGGTIDAWAEAFSAGVRAPGDLMLMYGSTLFIVAVTEAPLIDAKLWTTAGVEPGTHCLAAGMATSGSLIEWCRELFARPPVEELLAEAAAVPPGSDGLLLLPYFAGERSPIFDPDARGAIAGLTLSHGRGHIARAAFEGIACGVRHNLEVVEDVGGGPERLVAVGGGTRGNLWAQVVSDVAGVEQLLPEVTIGASYGDALLAAIGTGLVPSDTDWSVARETIAPRPENRETYDHLYGLYRGLYEQTVETTHALARLQRGQHGAGQPAVSGAANA